MVKRLTHIFAGHCLKKMHCIKMEIRCSKSKLECGSLKISSCSTWWKKNVLVEEKESNILQEMATLFGLYGKPLVKPDWLPSCWVFLYRVCAWPHDPWDEMFPLVSQCFVNFESKLILRKQPDKGRHNWALYSQSEQTLLSHLLEISVIVKMLSSMTTSQTEKCQQRAKWSPTKPLQCDFENAKLL